MDIKGAELALFENEAFPNGYYWDHELYSDEPDPDKFYDTNEIEGPYWIGEDSSIPEGMDRYLDLDTLINAWRATRDHDVAVIRIPSRDGVAASAEDIRAAAALLMTDDDACLRIAGKASERSGVITAEVIRAALTEMARPAVSDPSGPDVR